MEIPRSLMTELEQQNIVLVVGADLPKSLTGVPSRQELKNITSEVTQNRYQQTRLIMDYYATTGLRPRPIHARIGELIKRFNIGTIISFSYDELLHQVLENSEGCNFIVQNEDRRFFGKNKPRLINLFGTAHRSKSLSIFAEDFQWAEEKQLIFDLVKHEFYNHSVLFLGHRLSDRADLDFLLRFDNPGDKYHQPNFTVLDELSDEEKDRWQRLETEIIQFSPMQFLEEIAPSQVRTSTTKKRRQPSKQKQIKYSQAETDGKELISPTESDEIQHLDNQTETTKVPEIPTSRVTKTSSLSGESHGMDAKGGTPSEAVLKEALEGLPEVKTQAAESEHTDYQGETSSEPSILQVESRQPVTQPGMKNLLAIGATLLWATLISGVLFVLPIPTFLQCVSPYSEKFVWAIVGIILAQLLLFFGKPKSLKIFGLDIDIDSNKFPKFISLFMTDDLFISPKFSFVSLLLIAFTVYYLGSYTISPLQIVKEVIPIECETTEPLLPQVERIIGVEAGEQVLAGETMLLSVDTIGDKNLQYEWSDKTGVLQVGSNPTLAYLVPGMPGSAFIKVTVTNAQGQTISQTTEFQIIVPVTPSNTATLTPTFTPRQPTETPTLTPYPTLIIDTNNSPMILIPAGLFEMGSESGDANERPIHTVILDNYYIDQYEVTNEQFAIFLNKQGNQIEGGVAWLDVGAEDMHIHQSGSMWQADEGYGDHPVVEVTWYGANAYCEWRGARLPSEAEWEKAARGMDGRTYPWGEGISCNLANFSGCAEDTSPVGSYPDGASPYGVYDMAGNVWEWVNDWYDSNYYSTSPQSNPTGPGSGQERVVRGGSWADFSTYLRTAARGWLSPDLSQNIWGFRCARSLSPTLTPENTKTPTPTSTLTLTNTPTITPSSTPIGGSSGQIVFSARDEEGDLEIYFLDMFSDDLEPINLTTNKEDDYAPSWSPDGSSIVFVSNRDNKNNPDIWLMTISQDGQVLEEMKLTEELGVYDSPAWTPDGEKIVFTRRVGEPKIYSINPNGTNQKPIITQSGAYEHPSVSYPTSISPKKIVFQLKSLNKEFSTLYVMDMNGENQFQLMEGRTEVYDTSPKFSPDSTQVIFLSKYSTQYDIYIVNSDGTNLSQITGDLANESSPGWSPDGNYIIFVWELNGKRAIYILHKDDNDFNKQEIISEADFNLTDINFPAWRP